jgi:hypothetical protein
MQIIEFSDLGMEASGGSNTLPKAALDKLVETISSSDLTLIFGIPLDAPAVFELQLRREDLSEYDIGYFLHKNTRVYSIIATRKGDFYHA